MEEQIKSGRSGWFTVVRQVLVYGVLPCLALLLIAFVLICWSIRSSVIDVSAEAVREHPGDGIEALMACVDSDNHSLKQRNRAVWALGQIGDKRALGVLEKWYTGGPCDHDTSLCQRELAKAINLCYGAFNATAWLPR